MYFLDFMTFNAVISMVYVLACFVLFYFSTKLCAESLEPLKDAATSAYNALGCVIVSGDKRCFSKYRLIDLGKTVPNTIFLFTGAIASIALIVLKDLIPIDFQTGIALGYLICSVMYYIVDLIPEKKITKRTFKQMVYK